MKVSISGTRCGQPWPPAGDVIDLPDTEAASLCGQRLAEPVAQHRHVEKAVTPDDVEKAVPSLDVDKAVTPDDAEKAVPLVDAETRAPVKRRPGRPRKSTQV